ncbi:dihydroorotase [Ekhidna lutea]|uniref:Dihydroorotase n=1 Tax=Ekhidna lutea TaxID=447679 RepID=A0A239EMX2_EKHLU|nr:dihydroorotase [Ekhidna lutea]SNS45224.1 dihydroorotase [Ekhidna lutea]
MLLIKEVSIVNEGQIKTGDILIKDDRIEKIGTALSVDGKHKVIDGKGLHLFPGVIDDQVHFREPGLTHKGNIFTESRAAVAGGVTSFMEMPNVNPQTITQELLEAKYQIGAKNSLANYSFYMGSTNTNLDEVLKTDPASVCGIKIFMGSSTGNMLVDDQETLENIFRNAPILIATHCEDEATIRANTEKFVAEYGDNIPFKYHPVIRNEEACYLSSSKAVELAKKNDARLHILHISTGKETNLFTNEIPLGQKRITSEACIHHLWFSDADYDEKGAFIKWNPAVKSAEDRDQIWKALLDDRIDVIATDHAPHTLEEKQNPYMKAPSGGPLIQHTLVAMLDFYHQGKISLERIAEKMCHAVAECFDVKERGYIREGYKADLVLVDLDKPWTVDKGNIRAKCGWSPFDGHTFKSSIEKTFVSGHLAYTDGELDESKLGQRLKFDRK